MSDTITLNVTVNGEQRSVEIDPRRLLVEAIREDLDLPGTHIGCLTGDCGACTVERDGKITKSCLVLAASAEGRLHHSLFTKTRGGAEEACLEATDCRDLELAYNWISASPGAAFALDRVAGSSRVHHTVGDGVGGPLVAWTGPVPDSPVVHDLWTDLDGVAIRLASPVTLSPADPARAPAESSEAIELASTSDRSPGAARAGS